MYFNSGKEVSSSNTDNFCDSHLLNATLSQPQPIPRQPEAVQQAKRRTKTVSSLHMANATVNYHKSTEQLTEEFTWRYSLKPEEHYNIRREMRKMRLAQKMLMLRFRSMFTANVQTEADRERFLNWFEEESRLVANRSSDSDDSVVELGSDQPHTTVVNESSSSTTVVSTIFKDIIVTTNIIVATNIIAIVHVFVS